MGFVYLLFKKKNYLGRDGNGLYSSTLLLRATMRSS